jgi:hypothetical protein
VSFFFRLPKRLVESRDQQLNNEALETAADYLYRFVVVGDGAPAHTPDGVQVYLRRDGGAGTTLYVYEPGPAAWNALA